MGDLWKLRKPVFANATWASVTKKYIAVSPSRPARSGLMSLLFPLADPDRTQP